MWKREISETKKEYFRKNLYIKKLIKNLILTYFILFHTAYSYSSTTNDKKILEFLGFTRDEMRELINKKEKFNVLNLRLSREVTFRDIAESQFATRDIIKRSVKGLGQVEFTQIYYEIAKKVIKKIRDTAIKEIICGSIPALEALCIIDKVVGLPSTAFEVVEMIAEILRNKIDKASINGQINYYLCVIGVQDFMINEDFNELTHRSIWTSDTVNKGYLPTMGPGCRKGINPLLIPSQPGKYTPEFVENLTRQAWKLAYANYVLDRDIKKLAEQIRVAIAYKKDVLKTYRDIAKREPDPIVRDHYITMMLGGLNVEQIRERITKHYAKPETPSDIKPPNVTSFSASSSQITQGQAITLSYSVSDDVGLSYVRLMRADDTARVDFREIRRIPVSGKEFSGSITDTPPSAGTYRYGLHVVDTANKWNCERNSQTNFSPGQYGPRQVVVASVQQPNLPPQARITLRSGTSTAHENQVLQVTIPTGATAQVVFSGERSADPEGSPLMYQWLINGQPVNTARDFSFNLGRGTHQVLLKVRDSQGLEGSVGATVNVNEQVAASSITAKIDSFSAYPNKIHVGQTTTFRVSFTNTSNTSWTFGAGISLRRPDGARIDNLPTQPIRLNPNQQGTATWTYTIDREGSWDVVFGIWKDPAEKDLLTQTGWLTRFVVVEARPPKPPEPPKIDPKLTLSEQLQQLRMYLERLNYPTETDRRAVVQEFQRATQAILAAEEAAKRGDQATVQHQAAQAQQAINTVNQLLAQIEQRQTPHKTPSTNLPPQARITLRSGTSTAYENQVLQVTIPTGATAQVVFSGERSADPEGSLLMYQWLINGQPVNTARDFSFNLGRGTHQVLLKVKDSQGLEGSVGATVNVKEQVVASWEKSEFDVGKNVAKDREEIVACKLLFNYDDKEIKNLIPLVVFLGGKYYSAWELLRANTPLKQKILNVKRYWLYYKGNLIGSFSISGPIGKLENDMPFFTGNVNWESKPLGDLALIAENTIALSQQILQPFYPKNLLLNNEQKLGLDNIIRETLIRPKEWYKKLGVNYNQQIKGKAPKSSDIKTFILKPGGSFAVYGNVRWEGSPCSEMFASILALWNGRWNILRRSTYLAECPGRESLGDDNFYVNFVGDIDGDNVAELIISEGRWESWQISLYKVLYGKLTKVLDIGNYGS